MWLYKKDRSGMGFNKEANPSFCSEISLCCLQVILELPGQLIRDSEFLLVPDFFQKVNADVLPVQISIEVNDE